MSYLHIADETVGLPAPANIPTPRSRAALEKAISTAKARAQAHRDRDLADEQARRLTEVEPVRRGRAIVDGTDPGESPVAAARAAAVKAQEDLSALVEAERFVLADLRAAVEADRDAWTAQAAAEAQKALIKLATGLRMATEAGASLNDNIGMLGMFNQHEGINRLAPFHPNDSSQFDINVGIEGLRAGLSTATSELARYKPAKSGRVKKAAAAEDVDE